MTKETKSFAIQTHHMERTVLLTPSQAMPLTASQQQPPQPIAAVPPSPQGTPSPKQSLAQLSITHIYQSHSSHSSESFHSEELESICSVDHFGQLDGSSRSTSRESLDSKGSQTEEEGESSESESIIFCVIHGMWPTRACLLWWWTVQVAKVQHSLALVRAVKDMLGCLHCEPQGKLKVDGTLHLPKDQSESAVNPTSFFKTNQSKNVTYKFPSLSLPHRPEKLE